MVGVRQRMVEHGLAGVQDGLRSWPPEVGDKRVFELFLVVL